MNYWIVKTDADTYPFDRFERDRRTGRLTGAGDPRRGGAAVAA